VKVDVLTIFPRMVEALLEDGVLARAVKAGRIDLAVHDLRAFTTDRHHVVDDVPFGGGPGMVLKPEPIFAAVEQLAERRGPFDAVVLPTPAGTPLSHGVAAGLSRVAHLLLICGRYEGIDERVSQHLATHEISIGDYVLTGGELPALVLLDAVTRLVPGVVGDEASVAQDSFASGVLDHPHYTRPADFRGMAVPPVLLSGHHAAIARWRRREALRRTLARRPELLERAAPDAETRALLDELVNERERS
jgi:tRNA (guanine37-N1)-methyltransferase